MKFKHVAHGAEPHRLGAQNSLEGRVFVFGWAALWDPFK